MTNATTVPGGLQNRRLGHLEPAPATTPAELEAENEHTRVRLANTVDAIAERMKPANIARRAAASARAKVSDDHGNLRPERLALVAAVLAAGVAFVSSCVRKYVSAP